LYRFGERALEAKQAILATLSSTDTREVTGKKRLQKILRLAKSAGYKIDADYSIRQFGPFSNDIAYGADLLAITGQIEEQERQLGAAGFFTTVYSLPHDTRSPIDVSSDFRDLIRFLDRYTTVELEVASTIGHFLDMDYELKKSVHKTKELKPSKTKGAILEKAKEIVEQITSSKEKVAQIRSTGS
tara:strand:+ start:129 stop:686 length:558 start_codon:yes stop_codon:yes gene_type:complete